MTDDNWLTLFPALQQLEPEARRNLLAESFVFTAPANFSAFRSGTQCENFLMLLDGRIRVTVTAESGREILLYRVYPGETCIITTACLFAGREYVGDAVTETPIRGIALPHASFWKLLGLSERFRRFALEDFGARLIEIVATLEEVVFKPFDRRLLAWLLQTAAGGDRIQATHQEVATELGSAREVVSRHLKRLERQGLLRIERGVIVILDRVGIERLLRSAA